MKRRRPARAPPAGSGAHPSASRLAGRRASAGCGRVATSTRAAAASAAGQPPSVATAGGWWTAFHPTSPTTIAAATATEMDDPRAADARAPDAAISRARNSLPDQRGHAHADQDEHDRVCERVIVVVRQSDDHRRETRRPDGEGNDRPEETKSQPANGRAFVVKLRRPSPAALGPIDTECHGPANHPRHAARTTTSPAARRLRIGASVRSPTSGHPTTRNATIGSLAGSAIAPAPPPPERNASAALSSDPPFAARGRPTERSSGAEERSRRQRPRPRVSRSPERPTGGIGHEERRDHRRQDDAEHVAMHRDHGRRRQRRPTSLPVVCVHACHAAARATELDSAIRFGFQMNVDSSTALAETAISSAATSPRPNRRSLAPASR